MVGERVVGGIVIACAMKEIKARVKTRVRVRV